MTSPLRTGIVALIAIAFSTADSWAAKGAVKVTGARLTFADKKVSVAGQPAASGTTVAPGETVVTGRGSHAELTLPDGTVVRIGQASSFTYTGSKLVLNQGTALVRVAHKNTTVVSGSRTYSGGPAVVSMQAARGNDGLYILQGAGKVNGSPLIAGQTSVLDHGKDRTFTFDLQKLVGSSALVKKFPQTPWIVQTEALATVQHQLLTAKITPGAQSGKGAQLVASSGNASRVASQDIVSSTVAKLVSSGAAGTFTVNRAGNPVGLSGTLQFTGSPVSLGSNLTALIKSAANSPAVSGGNLQASGAVVFSSAVTNSVTLNGTNQIASLTNMSAGTLDVTGATRTVSGGTLVFNGGTLNTGGAVVITGAGGSNANIAGISSLTTGRVATLVTLNTSTPLASGINTLGTGAGALILTGSPNLTGATNNNVVTGVAPIGTNSGTLILTSGGLVNGLRTINLNANTSPTTVNYVSGTNVVYAGITFPQQAGQTVTINGINYISTQPGGAGSTLWLQPVVH